MMSCGFPLPACLARSNAARNTSISCPSTVCDVEADRLEPLGRIFALRLLRHRVERHGVRVVDEDQVVELLVARELDGLHPYALLHAAVARETHDVMIEDDVVFRVEPRLCHLGRDGHADGVADALAERSGGRLDAAGRVRQAPGVRESWSGAAESA